MNALRKRHNRIKRRIQLGMSQPGDENKLKSLRLILGYEK